MRRWIVGAAVVAAVGLAGCSASRGSDASASPSATVGSWSAWQKKILAAADAGSGDECVKVTAASCSTYVKQQMKPVDDLRDAVKGAAVAGKYPQLMSLVRGMDQVDAGFMSADCSDAAGSACVKDVTVIMTDSMDLTNMLPDPR